MPLRKSEPIAGEHLRVVGEAACAKDDRLGVELDLLAIGIHGHYAGDGAILSEDQLAAGVS